MSQEVQTISGPLTPAMIKNNINVIKEVMESLMVGPTEKEPGGVHYGIVPGCKKPTLLKPGAETLSQIFGFRSIIDNDRDIRIEELGNGHKNIHVYCHIKNSLGDEVATGVGSCSTMESKFRYRGGLKIFIGKDVPKNYWDLDKAGKKDEAKELIGGKGFGVGKNTDSGKWEICEFGEKMENPDIADVYNTVLKMAKKRAYVDGILSATAASYLFTQDIEDMPQGTVQQGQDKTAPDLRRPQSTEQAQAEEAVTYLDVITMLQGTQGAELNVIAFCIAVNHIKRPGATDKTKTYDITEYTVGDLAQNPTATAVIKVFGLPLPMECVDKKVRFHQVKVGEYNKKTQYTAQEAVL